MDHVEFLRQIGAKGNKAMRGTPMAKLRASKAARARWAKHAPGHIRDMFLAAIEAFMEWNEGEPEPTVTYEVDYEPREITISEACGLLWNCKDILPGGDYSWLTGHAGLEIKRQTYAAAARAMLEAIKSKKVEL